MPWPGVTGHGEPRNSSGEKPGPLTVRVPEASGWTRGERLKRLAHDRGLTLEALANSAGVGRATLYRIAAGESRGGLETWRRVAAALGMTLPELLVELGE